MNRKYSRIGIRLACITMALSLCVGNTGCGTVHGTDGQTLTSLGLTRWTNGKTQTEVGVGKGMDRSMGHYRANTFGDRSSDAMANLFNRN